MLTVMVNRLKRVWPDLSQSLAFVPGVVVLVFAVLGAGLVEVDRHLSLTGGRVLFEGDTSAARTVLSVIAGSLITVAGLTFSSTLVVLQLASSQFSPRILRTFFGDRLTQVTIGTYVGTFVYAMLVLRAVGASGGFVPRISVSVGTLLGIAAVLLLIVFLNHVSKMVQVSHVSATIAHATLIRTDRLYPEPYTAPVEAAEPGALLHAWRAEAAGAVRGPRPGFVQRVAADELAGALRGQADRVALLVCPGDFVSAEQPLAEVWPAGAADACAPAVRAAVSIASERDLDQDIDFGVRQLADTALRAISPGINDPTTAVTCIGYLQSILVRLTEHADPPELIQPGGDGPAVLLRRRAHDEYLDALLQVGRHADGDAWVAGALLDALAACTAAARRCGAAGRERQVRAVAAVITEQALDQARNDHDRAEILRRGAAVA